MPDPGTRTYPQNRISVVFILSLLLVQIFAQHLRLCNGEPQLVDAVCVCLCVGVCVGVTATDLRTSHIVEGEGEHIFPQHPLITRCKHHHTNMNRQSDSISAAKNCRRDSTRNSTRNFRRNSTRHLKNDDDDSDDDDYDDDDDDDDAGGDGWPASFTAANLLTCLHMTTKRTKPQM